MGGVVFGCGTTEARCRISNCEGEKSCSRNVFAGFKRRQLSTNEQRGMAIAPPYYEMKNTENRAAFPAPGSYAVFGCITMIWLFDAPSTTRGWLTSGDLSSWS